MNDRAPSTKECSERCCHSLPSDSSRSAICGKKPASSPWSLRLGRSQTAGVRFIAARFSYSSRDGSFISAFLA